jgi:hypothetical protein
MCSRALPFAPKPRRRMRFVGTMLPACLVAFPNWLLVAIPNWLRLQQCEGHAVCWFQRSRSSRLAHFGRHEKTVEMYIPIHQDCAAIALPFPLHRGYAKKDLTRHKSSAIDDTSSEEINIAPTRADFFALLPSEPATFSKRGFANIEIRVETSHRPVHANLDKLRAVVDDPYSSCYRVQQQLIDEDMRRSFSSQKLYSYSKSCTFNENVRKSGASDVQRILAFVDTAGLLTRLQSCPLLSVCSSHFDSRLHEIVLLCICVGQEPVTLEQAPLVGCSKTRIVREVTTEDNIQ